MSPAGLRLLFTDRHFLSMQVDLNSGNNVLYWRTTTYSLLGSAVKPVMLKNIGISGRSVDHQLECCYQQLSEILQWNLRRNIITSSFIKIRHWNGRLKLSRIWDLVLSQRLIPPLHVKWKLYFTTIFPNPKIGSQECLWNSIWGILDETSAPELLCLHQRTRINAPFDYSRSLLNICSLPSLFCSC